MHKKHSDCLRTVYETEGGSATDSTQTPPNPKVTIGICARNSQHVLGSAIESVARQDFPHEGMEIIFVDDGSEDKTLKIMKEHASKMDIPSRIFHGEWKGLGVSRNIVINNAKGDYVIWVDADETLEKDFVRKQMDAIEGNPAAGIATAKLWIPSENNPVLALELIPNIVEYSTQNWSRLSKNPGTGGTTYRLTAAKNVGGFDENIKGTGEDIDIARRMKQAGWLVVRGQGRFYEHHGGLSSWKELWNRYQGRGKQIRRDFVKASVHYSLYRINPFASSVAGLRYAVQGFVMTRLKLCLVLPLHFTFKMVAWFYGFSKVPGP